MPYQAHRNVIRLLTIILFVLPLLGQISTGSRAFSLVQDDLAPAALNADRAAPPPQDRLAAIGPTAVINCTDTTCPSAPAGLPHCIEEANFCVYYNSSNNTEGEATTVADHVRRYWDRYTTDFGFLPPLILGAKLMVRLEDEACTGSAWDDYIKIGNDCFCEPESIQKVVGHELFHRAQFNYDSDWDPDWSDIAWFYEGTARAMEDAAFDNIDNWPTCLSTCIGTFNKSVNSYLASTSEDITNMRYRSCLWWKYFMEQYGTTVGEPQLGVDALLALWQAVLTADDIAALNNALAALGAGVNFNTAFPRFAVANWTKDLASVPDASYNYIDEDQAGNCAPYGPLVPANGGTINIGTSATWSDENVNRYGIRYYKADIGANCPVISASFHRDSGPAFYHVVTQDGSTFKTHLQGSGTNWTQSFLNDGVTKVVAVVGSLGNSSQVDVTLECADPDIDIRLPNTGAKAYVQANTKFLTQVLVTNGSPTGPVVAGLTNSDFSAKVGGVNATVTGGGFIQEQYWLVVRAPAGLADGTYDLEIVLEEPGTSTVIDTDTEAQSIVYTTDLLDHVLVIDRSGSMGIPIESTDDKLIAAKDAANFYVDITRDNDGLAVVAYNHDVDPTPFAMQSVNSTVRTNAKGYINDWSTPNGIYPAGATSIGDGLYEARNQRIGSTTGNPLCSFVLLSDGMENSSQFWADVRADVQATDCPVTSIAFGPASNEALMEDIASDTGGIFFYNDVYVSTAARALYATTPASMTLELGGTYEYAQGRGEGRQRVLAETGQVSRNNNVAAHYVMIDDTISEALFALDWYERWWADLELELVKPDGTIIDHTETLSYTFPSPYQHTTHVGWRLPDPDPGEWALVVKHVSSEEGEVPYQVLVSGQSSLTLDLLLPDRLGSGYWTGNRFPIYAFLSGDGPMPNVPMQALVTAPDGTQTLLLLFDDGQHGDGSAGDGFYANFYTRVNQAEAVEPPEERGAQTQPTPQDEGAYRVRVQAMGTDFTREALGSFSVLEGPDTNGNGLPDTWEEENGVSDPNGDPDLDYLFNGDEYLAGTDPNNSDTDGGGENDGSEVDNGQDPLDPSDDEIEAPDFFQVAPLNGAVLLTYDVKAEYFRMELWRASGPEGPWNLQVAELPLDGSYEDPAVNGRTYYYRLIAEDAGTVMAEGIGVAAAGHRSAVLQGESVTPSIDPVPPQAFVLINGGAPFTSSRDVTLSFAPYEDDVDGSTGSFDDIVAMIISNDPFFANAGWQLFAQDVPWQLDANPGEIARVYVRFRDENDNESVGTEVGMILYKVPTIYLPPVFIYLPLVLR